MAKFSLENMEIILNKLNAALGYQIVDMIYDFIYTRNKLFFTASYDLNLCLIYYSQFLYYYLE